MPFSEIVDSIHRREELNGLESLKMNERVVWAIASVDFEANLGGAIGYLCNSSGDHLQLLATGFETIGCQTLAATTRSLLKTLSAVCDPANRTARIKAVTNPSDDLLNAMEAFEECIRNGADEYGHKLEIYVSSW